MASLTSAVQSACRAVTGTEYSFTGDLSAYLDSKTIAAGSLSGRLITFVGGIDATVTDAAGAFNYILANPGVIV